MSRFVCIPDNYHQLVSVFLLSLTACQQVPVLGINLFQCGNDGTPHEIENCHIRTYTVLIITSQKSLFQSNNTKTDSQITLDTNSFFNLSNTKCITAMMEDLIITLTGHATQLLVIICKNQIEILKLSVVVTFNCSPSKPRFISA